MLCLDGNYPFLRILCFFVIVVFLFVCFLKNSLCYKVLIYCSGILLYLSYEACVLLGSRVGIIPAGPGVCLLRRYTVAVPTCLWPCGATSCWVWICGMLCFFFLRLIVMH